MVVAWVILVAAGVTPWLASVTASVPCAWGFGKSRRHAARIVWFNLAAVLLIVGAFDAALRDEGDYEETITNEGFWRDDPDLGPAPAPGGRSHHVRRYRGDTLFDVTYTLDARGLRSGPPDASDAPRACILIFGCSFAFGGGLADEDTLSYQLARQLKGKRLVRNFAVGGYGPHHMLAMIRNGSVEARADCVPTDALYVTISEHVLRAAGRGDGLYGGPRFELDTAGQLQRRGNFPRQPDSGLQEKLALGASLSNDPASAGDAEVALFRALVQTSQRELERRFPGIRFHILAWHPRGPLDERLFVGLSPASLSYVADLLPVESAATGPYRIPHDGHPTALANQLLAAQLAARWFDTPSSR